MRHWLIKEEPSHYSWDDLVKDGWTVWDGVRSHMAKFHLAAMAPDDLLLFYHSVSEKAVVGVARVRRERFPDPTDEAWIAVEVEPVRRLERPVTLAEIRADPLLSQMVMARQSRLSVSPVTPEQFDRILELAAGDRPGTPTP